VSKKVPPKGLPKAFQSPLEPFYDFISKERKARKTWREIAELISKQGTPCTAQGVWIFFKRRRRRRYALGMEPDPEPVRLVPPAPGAAVAAQSPAADPQPAQSTEPAQPRDIEAAVERLLEENERKREAAKRVRVTEEDF
jgi:hypothetical protein